MNNAPAFDITLLGSSKSKLNFEFWPTVMDLWNQKKYREAFLALFDYIDPQLVEKHANAARTEFVIPHGSTVLTVSVIENQIRIRAPFLKVPVQNRVPILRQIAQLNFYPLTITQLVLEGEDLFFQFSTPLELCDPYKLYDTYKEICSNADFYDDDFISKFGASRLVDMKVEPFPAPTLNIMWEKWQQYMKEGLEALNYFEEKRLFGFAWDSALQTFMKIDYFMAPQGMVKNRIERVVTALYREAPLNERLYEARQNFTELTALSEEDLKKNLYIPETFISPKFRVSLENVQERFKQAYETSKKELGSNDFTGATLTLLTAFLNLFYYNNVPDDIAAIVSSAMIQSDRKPWETSAKALFNAMETVQGMKKV